MINSIYYGKVVETQSRINTDFNFGYEQASQYEGGARSTSESNHTTNNLREVSETQVQFMETKISSIQVYFEDLKQYYQSHKEDLLDNNSSTSSGGTASGSPSKKSSADLQFYWNKKIE